MKPKKYPGCRVATIRDEQTRQDFDARFDDQASLIDTHQLAAGYIQHPLTRLYQVWLSTSGLDIVCLAAYRNQAQADGAVDQLQAFLRTPDVHNESKCAAMFAQLASAGDGEPQPLPDDLVRHIGREILRRVVDGPR
jgi:hypothetical protein